MQDQNRTDTAQVPDAEQPFRSGLASRHVMERKPSSPTEHRKLPRRIDRPQDTNRAADDGDDPEQRYRNDELR